MLKNYFYLGLQYIITIGFCFNLAAQSYESNRYQTIPSNTSQKARSSAYEQQRPYKRKLSRKEAIAQMDSRDQDINRRAHRMGDWDYKSNWRYDRKAFYSGETQQQANREEHPYGPPGIGYDGDREYQNYWNNRNERNERNERNQDYQRNPNSFDSSSGYSLDHPSGNRYRSQMDHSSFGNSSTQAYQFLQGTHHAIPPSRVNPNHSSHTNY